jgi:hydroxyacylglutathione hydrolase
MNIQQFTFNPFQENTYIIYSEKGDALIIDPGCYDPNEEEVLKSFISSKNLTVKFLINTHLHIDHVFGNAFIEETYNVKTIANQGDEYWLKGLEAQARMFGLKLRHSSTSIGQNIEEGEQIILGSEIFDIFHVPGHSPGSIVLYNAKNNCVFVGDVLFEGSIGRTDLQGGNYQLLIEGIQKKLLTLPDETIVYCGHGPSTTIGNEKSNNPYI